MKKIAILFAAFLIAGFCNCSAVEQVKVSPSVNSAINKYKQQNYTGCIQDLKPAVLKNPNDALAQYYLAISYVQLGMKEEAKAAFEEVIANDTTGGGLANMSKKALACYDGTGKCSGQEGSMSAFVKSGEFMAKEAKDKIRDAQLQQVMDSINSGEKDINLKNYRLLNDASSAMPTNEEIANAVKVLAKAGFNPYAENAINPAIVQNSASTQLAQLNALMGQSTSSGNSYSNLLPYMMAQTGTDNPGNSKMNTQLMQTMMLNQMMPNLTFDSYNDRNR